MLGFKPEASTLPVDPLEQPPEAPIKDMIAGYVGKGAVYYAGIGIYDYAKRLPALIQTAKMNINELRDIAKE